MTLANRQLQCTLCVPTYCTCTVQAGHACNLQGNHVLVIRALLNKHDNQTNWVFVLLRRKSTVNGQKGPIVRRNSCSFTVHWRQGAPYWSEYSHAANTLLALTAEVVCLILQFQHNSERYWHFLVINNASLTVNECICVAQNVFVLFFSLGTAFHWREH